MINFLLLAPNSFIKLSGCWVLRLREKHWINYHYARYNDSCRDFKLYFIWTLNITLLALMLSWKLQFYDTWHSLWFLWDQIMSFLFSYSSMGISSSSSDYFLKIILLQAASKGLYPGIEVETSDLVARTGGGGDTFYTLTIFSRIHTLIIILYLTHFPQILTTLIILNYLVQKSLKLLNKE